MVLLNDRMFAINGSATAGSHHSPRPPTPTSATAGLHRRGLTPPRQYYGYRPPAPACSRLTTLHLSQRCTVHGGGRFDAGGGI